MTREKREIIRRMRELEASIEAEEAFGCNPPNSWIDRMAEEYAELTGKLAKLCHYSSFAEMEYDTREMDAILSRRCTA